MDTSKLLDQLERRATDLPESETKHDPDAEIDAMARWLHSLDSSSRVRVLDGLLEWVNSSDEWRIRAALLLSAAFGHATVIDEAARRAQLRGDKEPSNLELDLIDTLSRFPTHSGLAYLRDQAARLSTASSYRERRAAVRAAITLCFLGQGPIDSCLREIMSQLRAWSDPGLMRSALALMHALFVGRHKDPEILKRVLTPSEQQLVST